MMLLALLRLAATLAGADPVPAGVPNDYSGPAASSAPRSAPGEAPRPAVPAELRGFADALEDPNTAGPRIDRIVENSAQRGSASVPVPSAGPAAAGGAQTFRIREGANDHLFFRSPDAAVHAVVTGGGPAPRILLGFPAGDSGAGLWFNPSQGTKGGEAFRASGPLRETGPGQVELQVQASVPRLTMKLPVILDSVRAIRDRNQNADGPRLAVIAQALQELKAASSQEKAALKKRGITADALRQMLSPSVRVLPDGSVEFSRRALGTGEPYRLTVIPRAGTTLAVTKDGLVITGSGQGHPDFSVAASVGYPPLTPLDQGTLLNAAGRRCVAALGGPLKTSLRNLDFLAFKEKFLAGSWQYQTYFGRDTMMTAQMLAPVLSPQAVEAGLDSVLARVSRSGEVAHEENLGDEAALMRLDRFNRERKAGKDWAAAVRGLDGVGRPLYDHKMVDEDFLLPLLAQEYVHDVPPQESAAFLGERSPASGTRAGALDRTCRRVEDLARPYAAARAAGATGADLVKHLISLKPGQIVGDWRDSGDGLGGGRYPSSVNAGLVAAAVRACEATGGNTPAGDLEAVARAWDQARQHFMVHLASDEVRRRLHGFLAAGGYSAAERKVLERVQIDGVSLGDYLQGRAVPAALSNGVDYMAVALYADGTPVEVESSDAGLVMYENSLPAEQSAKLSAVLSLPFPIGLATPVGLLAANPALSSRPGDYALFDRSKYHGTVVWNWPMQVAQAGLSRQLDGLSPQNPDRAKLQGTLRQMQGEQKAAGGLGNSELYGIKFDRGQIRPTAFDAATESNPVQLWSNLNLRTDCGAFIGGGK